MPFAIAALTLFAALMARDAEADTEAERLAEEFSPILILAIETGQKWGDIKVTKPEPVEIMGAQSAENLRFEVSSSVTQAKLGDVDSYLNWHPPLLSPNVVFSQDRFAFFVNGLDYQGDPPGDIARGTHVVKAYFDFPGSGTTRWNAEYDSVGENFPTTAYVHIYKRVVEQYRASYDSVTVIQYFYFYPYNDWWNNHEGDWQRIDVVVSSSDLSTATILGVEFRFHDAWLNYYKDWRNKPGLTSSFVFNPRTDLKLSPGSRRDGLVQYTHPVVYVGAGSHGGYPVGGKIQVYHDVLEGLGQLIGMGQEDSQGAVGGDYEYMTHTGLVLATQAPASGSSLWERYRLQLLPEPDPDNTNNMGLDPGMSWLGARIRWGTLDVGGIGISESPHGPYDSNSEDWGQLEFFEVGETGPGWIPDVTPYEMHHGNLPYASYHHWAILGEETWSGTVNLLGDVVVFPGAQLTIEAGTTTEFPYRSDRHQFKEGDHGLSEIFVYGTLTAEGTSASGITFQKAGSDGQGEYAWGGIRKMDGGTIDVNSYTRILDARPLTVAFGAASYVVPLSAGSLPSSPTLDEQADRSVSVTVEMTPAPSLRAVTIPVTVTAGDAESGDYTVSGLTSGGLAFAVGDRFQRFTITAHADTDTDYEHLGVGFGTLPEGVVAGDPATATVTIEDVGTVPPKSTEGLSVTAGDGQLTVAWDAVVAEPVVTGYGLQYQSKPVWSEWSGWSHLAVLDAGSTGHVHDGLHWPTRYRYQVRASNPRGDGEWSEAFPPNGVFPRPPRPVPVWVEPLDDLRGRVTVACPYPDPLVCSPLPEDCPDPATCLPFTTQIGWTAGDGSDAAPRWYAEAFGVAAAGPGLSTAGGWTVTAHHVGRLDPAVPHRFQVRIVDADGQAGEASEPAWLVPLDAQPGAAAGSVDLSWRRPAGAALTGVVHQYRYRTGPDPWGAWQGMEGSGPSTTQHTVEGLTPGVTYDFQVRAVEGTGASGASGAQGAGAVRTRVTSFSSQATPDTEGTISLTQADPPRVGEEMTATLTDPDNPQLDDAVWTWERTGGATGGGGGPSGAVDQGNTYTPGQLDRGYTIRVSVIYLDGNGVHTVRHTTPTVEAAPPSNRAPEITRGPERVGFAENGTDTVATYAAVDAEGDALTWSRGGADAGAFTLRGDTLSFAIAPDFEQPADQGRDNVYEVDVSVRDGRDEAGTPDAAADTTVTVRVTVTNVDEPGSVVLSTGTPQVDQEVTATLRDPDGDLTVRPEDWQWQRRGPDETTWETVSGMPAGRSTAPAYPERSRYQPASADVGQVLRAVVNSYEDGHGAGKRAHSGATEEPVRGRPTAPRKLQATPGDRQVALKWSAPASDGGSAITGYAYQDSVAGGAWSGWQSIEGSDGSTRRHTVGNLTNGTEYTFELRAVNAVGAGASVRVEATPRRPDTPGRVEVGPTQPRVGETLKPTLVDPDTPVEVTGWRWRRLASWDRSADIDSASAPPSSERWTQVVGRTRKYKPVKADLGRRLRVEVDYTDRSGAQGARTTTPPVQAGPPCAPPDLAAAAGDEDGQVELTWGAACNHGSAIRQYQYQHLGASAWEPVSGDGSARRQVVDGLTAGQTYPFQVRARNGVGPGPPSQVTVALPDPDPPDDPPPPRPGTITLEPSIAQTCARLTATLRDADGGIDLEPSHSPTTEPPFTYGWVWDPRSFPSDGPASARRDPGTSVTQDHIPPNSSVGRFIEVTARYGDNRSDRNEVLDAFRYGRGQHAADGAERGSPGPSPSRASIRPS